jgi:hypothetical protein
LLDFFRTKVGAEMDENHLRYTEGISRSPAVIARKVDRADPLHDVQAFGTPKRVKTSPPGASKKALTASLRSLEAAQIVVRRDLSNSVLHVEYELANGIKTSSTILFAHLAGWGNIDYAESPVSALSFEARPRSIEDYQKW